jgi:hypothetical protein
MWWSCESAREVTGSIFQIHEYSSVVDRSIVTLADLDFQTITSTTPIGNTVGGSAFSQRRLQPALLIAAVLGNDGDCVPISDDFIVDSFLAVVHDIQVVV